MKSLIIYYSKYNNNTEKIAKIFADKTNADLIKINDSEPINISTENYSLIGFGSGVYNESLSPKLFNIVEKLNLKGKNVFVFSTSSIGFKFYNKKIINILKSKGAICKGSFACKGNFDYKGKKIFELISKGSQGHPNDEDYNKASNFIENLKIN